MVPEVVDAVAQVFAEGIYPVPEQDDQPDRNDRENLRRAHLYFNP